MAPSPKRGQGAVQSSSQHQGERDTNDLFTSIAKGDLGNELAKLPGAGKETAENCAILQLFVRDAAEGTGKDYATSTERTKTASSKFQDVQPERDAAG